MFAGRLLRTYCAFEYNGWLLLRVLVREIRVGDWCLPPLPISTPSVWKYLTGSGLDEREGIDREEWENDNGSMRVIMYPALDHAQILMNSAKYAPVIEHILRSRSLEASD